MIMTEVGVPRISLITLAIFDNESGVDQTYYQINGGLVKNVGADGQPFITEEGKNNVLIYWSADNAGNQEPRQTLSTIKLDKTVPTGSIKINDGAASTTSTQVKLTLSSEDATSGVSQMRFFDLIYGEWEEYAIFLGCGRLKRATLTKQFMFNSGTTPA